MGESCFRACVLTEADGKEKRKVYPAVSVMFVASKREIHEIMSQRSRA
jgi:hypothetical protein